MFRLDIALLTSAVRKKKPDTLTFAIPNIKNTRHFAYQTFTFVSQDAEKLNLVARFVDCTSVPCERLFLFLLRFGEQDPEDSLFRFLDSQ